jgi:hypothetical protein
VSIIDTHARNTHTGALSSDDGEWLTQLRATKASHARIHETLTHLARSAPNTKSNANARSSADGLNTCDSSFIYTHTTTTTTTITRCRVAHMIALP